MPTIQFQGPLTGTLEATIVDNDGSPLDVLEASKDFHVEVEWEVNDFTAEILSGFWQLDLYAESIGQGFEGQLTFRDVEVEAGEKEYSTTLTVEKETVPNNPAPPPPPNRISGAYKLVLVLSHRNEGGTTTSIAGIVEFPVTLIR